MNPETKSSEPKLLTFEEWFAKLQESGFRFGIRVEPLTDDESDRYLFAGSRWRAAPMDGRPSSSDTDGLAEAA